MESEWYLKKHKTLVGIERAVRRHLFHMQTACAWYRPPYPDPGDAKHELSSLPHYEVAR